LLRINENQLQIYSLIKRQEPIFLRKNRDQFPSATHSGLQASFLLASEPAYARF
jgi:hypothetical protein